ncbi:hypothetical protein F2P81_005797 [Scophthalmus maximus]|uniref:Uncharacterized protein n=1 Tax=Scophthalmus maximus TaxID=52904 RepID=A0A6A4TAM5_SCOMX|nr:hypothetical protein F2P81_005797 [Scophthalmus maximus]
MTCEVHSGAVEQEQARDSEVRAYRGVWWVLGFQQPREEALVSPAAPSPARQSLAGRKRLHRVTRLLLSVLPRWLQGAMGYPVSSSIGRSLSPEIRVSPTKPCGKGSKRKQDELDEDEEEEEHPTWVEALNQELADDEDPEEDPDYEPSSVETESEEYRSHNNTESDIEVQGKIVIEDVNVLQWDLPARSSCGQRPDERSTKVTVRLQDTLLNKHWCARKAGGKLVLKYFQMNMIKTVRTYISVKTKTEYQTFELLTDNGRWYQLSQMNAQSECGDAVSVFLSVTINPCERLYFQKCHYQPAKGRQGLVSPPDSTYDD